MKKLIPYSLPAACFLSILLLPFFLEILGKDVVVNPQHERDKTWLPNVSIVDKTCETSFATVLDFIKCDGHGCRTKVDLEAIFIDYYTSFSTKIFHKNPFPKKVIKGSNGYYFLGDNYSDVVLESKGIRSLDANQLTIIRNEMSDRKKWLDSLGIDYYILLIPNKHTVYQEELPILKSDRITELDQVYQLFLSLELNVTLPIEALKNQKNERIYYKTDTHWNDYGAYLAYTELIKKIKKEHPTTRVLGLDEVSFSSLPVMQGDLTKMLNLYVVDTNRVVSLKNQFSREQPKELEIPGHYRLHPDEYEKRFISSSNTMKSLIFRDSFGDALKPYLAESFGEAILINDNYFNKELILKERPTILIQEVVERNMEEFGIHKY